MKEIYKKNDVISFMTRDPEVHILEMFGYDGVNPEDVGKKEYVGRIKAVIDNGKSYLVSTLSPRMRAICIADAAEVNRRVELGELSPEELEAYNNSSEYNEAPNVYLNGSPVAEGQNAVNDERYAETATNAVRALFPDTKIVGARVEKKGMFSRDGFIDLLDFSLENVEDGKKIAAMRKMYDDIVNICRKARFKEYRTVIVQVEKPAGEDDVPVTDGLSAIVIENWLIAVDRNCEEASVMRNIKERTSFAFSLGPEFYDMQEACDCFRDKCLA